MNFTNLKNLEAKMNKLMISKMGLWFLVSLAISLIFFPEFWASLGTMLSLDWVFGQYHAAPWGVLGLCGIWLWLKRKEVWRGMLESCQVRRLKGWQVKKVAGWKVKRLGRWNFINLQTLNFINLQTFKPFLVGAGLVAGAILLPASPDFLVFQVLLASLGVFVILFGRGARIPSILLGIYGFAISFPLMIERFAEDTYSRTAITPLMGLITTLGYPLDNQGQWVHFVSFTGEHVSAAITAACAGPATMGVFLAIFALMMLDSPLPPKKAVSLLLLGVVGTWFQSFIRLLILMLVAFYWGEGAMWTAHFWSIYILFPLWYLLFAYIYFGQAGGKLKMQNEKFKIRAQGDLG